MPSYRRSIHWFRRDLRLTDNLSLRRAVDDSAEVIPVYVASCWKGRHHWTGPGRQGFLCGCLEALDGNVEAAGGRLVVRRGEAVEELERLVRENEVEAVYWNRDPDPFGRETENRLRERCRSIGVAVHEFDDVTLHRADEILTGGGKPYRVYTPFSRTWFQQEKPDCVPAVKSLKTPSGIDGGSIPKLADWGYGEPGIELPEAGERVARRRMKDAIAGPVLTYAEKRDDPAAGSTSHLGAHLRYGTVSAREVFHRAQRALDGARTKEERDSIFTFQKQLAWREFFMSVLWHYPEVLETDFNEQWRTLEWDDPEGDDRFQRWQEGTTGFPLVDAGMRQLRATGYMHNRLRMITAMFLTKDLHIHWRHGEAHFLRHLLDGEIANNNGGWQWSAGTGADAAPYFRIQNPWTQTERHDPEGAYIRRWVPELRDVDPRRFRKPPQDGQSLAKGYPLPLVDHAAEREETLRRFQVVKERNT